MDRQTYPCTVSPTPPDWGTWNNFILLKLCQFKQCLNLFYVQGVSKKRCDRFLPISQPLQHPQKKFWAFANSPFRGLLENVQKLKDWVKIGRDIHKSMKRKENLNVKIARIYEQSFSNLFPFQFKMFFFYSDQLFCRRIRGIQICIPVQSMVFYFFSNFNFRLEHETVYSWRKKCDCHGLPAV